MAHLTGRNIASTMEALPTWNPSRESPEAVHRTVRAGNRLHLEGAARTPRVPPASIRCLRARAANLLAQTADNLCLPSYIFLARNALEKPRT